jgi:CheY-like chemotaxis protein
MNPKILLVDEDPEILGLVGGLLEAYGYDVVKAGSGFAGCVAAWRERPDLIVMDVRMSDLDPADAVRALRDEPDTVETPVLAITDPTVPTFPPALRRSLELLAKPFSLPDLVDRVRDLLPTAA